MSKKRQNEPSISHNPCILSSDKKKCKYCLQELCSIAKKAEYIIRQIYQKECINPDHSEHDLHDSVHQSPQDKERAVKYDIERDMKNNINPPLEHILTDTELRLFNATGTTPLSCKQLGIKANCSYVTARKYLPNLSKRRFIQKAPKNGYYRCIGDELK